MNGISIIIVNYFRKYKFYKSLLNNIDKLDKKYSVGKILESLSKCNCYQIQSNYYLFNYYDDVLNDIGTILDLDFSRKYMRLQDIKKNLGNVKK